MYQGTNKSWHRLQYEVTEANKLFDGAKNK